MSGKTLGTENELIGWKPRGTERVCGFEFMLVVVGRS